MDAERKIFVDVTQLVHWAGHLTGIPRVMYELAVRFAGQPNTRFVSWVGDRSELCEINFAQTIAKRGRGIVYLHEGELSAPSERGISAIHGVRAYTRKAIKAGARRALHVCPGLTTWVEARVHKSVIGNLQPAAFQSGDVLFIPWGEWWDERFTDYVVRQEESGVRIVQIIHDIAPTVQPQFFEQVRVSPTIYNAKVLPKAAMVLAVSQNTKRELNTWLGENNYHVPPIEVVRNGDDIKAAKPARPTDESFVTADIKGGDFLLTVGTIEAKKNHALLYYVYKLAKARKVNLPKLVIVGRRGYRTDDIYEIMTHDPEVKGQFVFLHNASDEELAWLYDNCLFTVLPSFHEGWGIPIAESVARGVPCLASNTSSMVEIAEGIVGHFSPASSDECLAAIQALLDPKALARARAKAKHYHPTSWDNTFDQVIMYLKEL